MNKQKTTIREKRKFFCQLMARGGGLSNSSFYAEMHGQGITITMAIKWLLRSLSFTEAVRLEAHIENRLEYFRRF